MKTQFLSFFFLGSIVFLQAQSGSPIVEEMPRAIPDLPNQNIVTPISRGPKAINQMEIAQLVGYPDSAKLANIEGNIIFRVLIDTTGKYIKHLPPKSGHPILIKAVEEHIAKIRFTPAMQGDRPIRFWVNVPFSFRLTDKYE